MSHSTNSTKTTRRGFLVTGGIAAIGVLSGCLGQTDDDGVSTQGNPAVTMFKSPACVCCSEYADYLEAELGSPVRIVDNEDMSAIKADYGIPESLVSCHTVDFGEYFVEGHVPYAAIDRLLTESPAVAGIALPDMPSGSPGMPGAKTEPFTIYTVSDDGSSAVFTTV